jgi:DNA-binding MarR family transcriptional regulator
MATAQPKKQARAPSVPRRDAELLEQCALFDVHRLSRALTVLYNKHMRETGLTMAQFTLLRNIAALAPAGMTQIAEAMLMDRTSVTRLIEPLIQLGLLTTEPGVDRRVRNVIVTAQGLAALERSERAWRQAQQEFYDCVGPEQWRATRGALRTTLKMVREQDGGHSPDRH